MNFKTLSASLTCLVALSACGGGNTTDSSKSALDGACTPANGTAGTQVTCPAKDVDNDCTFFFAGRPTDFTLDQENGSFSFTVPVAITGTQEMSFQCGDAEPLSAGTFDVTSSVNDDVSVPNGDETITPTGTAGEGTGGTTAGDGTTGGTTTGGETTGAEIPATTTATINSFTVTPVTDGIARMGTFQVTYSYSNAQAAYLWGNMLNRTSWDATLDASESCKLQGGRYLAANQDGSDLMAGSETYEKWQYASEGTLCDDSTECLSQSTTTAHFTVAQPKAATPVAPSVIATLIPEANPNCRIDLKQADGTLVTSDSFYTRSLVQTGNLCLAVQGTDGNWQVQCLSGDALNAKAVDLDPYSPVTITPSTTKIGFDVTLKAVNVTALQVYCSQDDDELSAKTLTIDAITGAALYTGTCNVDAETKSVIVRAYGVGDNNVKQKTYTLTMDKPDVKLKLTGSAPSQDETSKIDLEYSATRPYTIKDEAGAVVSEGSAAWLKQRKFTGFKNVSDKDYLDGKKHDITSPGQLDGKINNVNVDYDYTKWTYKVYDFDGNEYEDSYSAPKDTYETSFSWTKTDVGHGNGYGGEGDHSCHNAKDLILWMDFDWTANNIQSLSAVGDGCELSGDLPNADTYGAQSGSARVEIHKGKKSGNYTAKGNCTFHVVYGDGSTEDQEFNDIEYDCK